MKVTARATRSGDWWAVEVPEVQGVFTQARRLDQVPDMVRDAVALMTGHEPADIEVDVRASTHVDDQITDVLLAKVAADRAASHAAELQRDLAVVLVKKEGMTVRDAGTLLQVSPQRISQLVKK